MCHVPQTKLLIYQSLLTCGHEFWVVVSKRMTKNKQLGFLRDRVMEMELGHFGRTQSGATAFPCQNEAFQACKCGRRA